MTSKNKFGRGVVLFTARPNPAFRVLVEMGVGGECVAGWFMDLAYSGVNWKTRLYNYVLGPMIAPVEARRFCQRYDVFLIPPHALPLGFWIKKWRPHARVIYFNHDSFLANLRRKPWYFRRYFETMLAAVDGVNSGSWLPDCYAAEILSVPRTISHLFASEEFDGICRDPNSEDLIIVAALHSVKGIREGISIFQSFRSRLGRPVTLTIIGDGPLRKELEDLNSNNSIRFLGQQDRSVVVSELARSSVLLMLSQFDSMSVAVLEAARVGVLPLMTDTVGASVFFPSELVVPVGNYEVAVNRLLWLYQLSVSEQKVLRERVRTVSNQFTCERQCGEFRVAVDDLLRRIEASDVDPDENRPK